MYISKNVLTAFTIVASAAFFGDHHWNNNESACGFVIGVTVIVISGIMIYKSFSESSQKEHHENSGSDSHEPNS